MCNANADCLSGDDESAEICSKAMSQLAFATFATTVMVTYLVTYMKYIREIRDMTVNPGQEEENRLDEINMRELERENSATS